MTGAPDGAPPAEPAKSAGEGDVSGPERILAGFALALRGAGVSVPTGSVVTYSRALGALGLDDPDRVYWAGRATLIRRPEDIAAYDRVFASYWKDLASSLQPVPTLVVPVTIAIDDDSDAEAEGEGDDDEAGQTQVVRYSAVETLRERDLATLTQEEWAEAQRLISALRFSAEMRPSRRTRPSRRRSGGRPDLRRTIRRNIALGGVPLRRSWRVTVDRPRRMVFLLDVSGSMEPYAAGPGPLRARRGPVAQGRPGGGVHARHPPDEGHARDGSARP